MGHIIKLLPTGSIINAESGANLLELLREYNAVPEAPCGGHGTCGKCRVRANGESVLSCQYEVHGDITVELPSLDKTEILIAGELPAVSINPLEKGHLLAFDIGTTTVVCFLMNDQGKQLAVESMLNPQAPYGADVVTRIRNALDGNLETLTNLIRDGMTELTKKACQKAGIAPEEISVVSVVGNPCMQQLFMGISPVNLAAVPFDPVIVKADVISASDYLPVCTKAKLIVVPDISGYVGADTLACVIATGIYTAKDTVLMVDIGTNGEMVLSHGGRMVACSTAAGPALEGANIRFGMRGAEGAIDHVYVENGDINVSTIGGLAPKGICGSGLIDAVAVMIETGALNKRGRIQTADAFDGERAFKICDGIYLTQEDISQVQLAKGAIAAGIHLMAQHLGIGVEAIDRVLLAGAFGTFLNPDSACKIGLLPPELNGKITAVGNIAGSGAQMLACDKAQLDLTQNLLDRIEFLELAQMPNFQRMFAQSMRF